MRNKIGIGIVLISLLLLVSSQVLPASAAPRTLFPLNIGDLFIYDVEDNIGQAWTMHLFISGQAKIAMNKKTMLLLKSLDIT